MSENPVVYYVVEGTTEAGEKFRPSDWIHRMASMAAKYKNGRLSYSQDIYPDVHNNKPCLIYTSDLKKKNPSMYMYITNFIKSHKLRHFAKS